MGGDVDADQAFAEGEPVEALERGRSAAEARGREAGIQAPAAAGARGEVAERRLRAARPVARRAPRVRVVGEVRAVGADRRGGQAALGREERQVGINRSIETRRSCLIHRSAPAISHSDDYDLIAPWRADLIAQRYTDGRFISAADEFTGQGPRGSRTHRPG